MAPAPPNPYSDKALSKTDAALYLARIGLDESVLEAPPSLSQLAQLQLASLETVPKDTGPLHVPSDAWTASPDASIVLGSAPLGMPEGGTAEAFTRIVKQHMGSFCFSANATFATLLRTLKYRVSEVGSRCYKCLGENPRTHPEGWKFGTLTHECLLVDWEGCAEGERYLVDVMFGPTNLAVPLLLKHGSQTQGLNRYEAYQLLYEHLPISPGEPKPIDALQGWTLYRRISPRGQANTLPLPVVDKDDNSGSYWSPQFHFLPISLPVLDFGMLHLYSSVHQYASFSKFLLITRLIPGGKGARRSMMYAPRPKSVNGGGDGEVEEERAKVYTTGGEESEGTDEGRDVEWVPMRVGPLKEWLVKNLGYKFD